MPVGKEATRAARADGGKESRNKESPGKRHPTAAPRRIPFEGTLRRQLMLIFSDLCPANHDHDHDKKDKTTSKRTDTTGKRRHRRRRRHTTHGHKW
jgi:hypothetical protein